MKASNRIINKIKEFEGFSAKPYYDSAGVLTIGYGTTKDASKYQNISKETATQLLLRDLAVFETQLNNYINNRGYSLNQNQYDALISFLYNVGSIRSGSSLDKSIRRNAPASVSANLKTYIYAGGKPLKGLVKRRSYEANLFSSAFADIGKAILTAIGFMTTF